MSTSNSIQNKWRVRWGLGLIRFSGMILLIGSVVKSLHLAKAVAYMQFFGYANQTVYLIAAIELVTAALFLRRSTRAVGLLLVSAYMGGAIAAHLAYHPLKSDAPIVRLDWNHPVPGTMPAVVVLQLDGSGPGCGIRSWWERSRVEFGRGKCDPCERLRGMRASDRSLAADLTVRSSHLDREDDRPARGAGRRPFRPTRFNCQMAGRRTPELTLANVTDERLGRTATSRSQPRLDDRLP